MSNIPGTNIPKPQIGVTLTQKDIIHRYFDNHFTLLGKYCKLLTNDYDQNFRYFVFKEYIFAASDMIRDLDYPFYNKNFLSSYKVIKNLDDSHIEFKAQSKHVQSVYVKEFLNWQEDYVLQKKRCDDLQEQIQMLVSKEARYANKLKKINERERKLKKMGKEEVLSEEQESKIKIFRREHVDVIHLLGENYKELSMLQELLENFEEEHKALFHSYFKIIKEKLESKYKETLNYFGYKFNQKIFSKLKQSQEIQKFKQKSHIMGDLSLCKYFEYHIKNIQTEALSDPHKKEALQAAKQYCRNQKERENLF